MREMIKMVITLTVLAAFSGGLLSVVKVPRLNSLSRPYSNLFRACHTFDYAECYQ
jgi:Na+-translocating ferredoxin:NAD+ oxidoreductase RnfG subunit